MDDKVDYLDFQSLDHSEYEKLIEEIDKEIMRSVLIPKLEPTELPKLSVGNYARQFEMYGVPVIEDPTKLYILKVDIPEGKKPWYKRLWQYFNKIFKHLRYERNKNYL